MKRTTGAMVLLAALSGCVTMDSGGGCGGGGYMSQVWNPPAVGGGPGGAHCGGYQVASVPGMVGPWGQPVAANGPYAAVRTDDTAAARMMSTSVPLDVFQQTLAKNTQPGSGIVQAQAFGPGPGGPNGMGPAPGMNPAYGASPGFSLGVGNMACPGGVPGCAMPPGMPGAYPPGAVAAVGTANSHGAPSAPQRTEVRFVGPAGMKISWYAPTPDGKAGFTSQYLEAPGRYNFMQAAIYRLKLSDIPNRPGVELYPTLEVVPTNHRTSTFLAHSAVPISFSEEDFQQVAAGNYVVKVIYLPDPQFQDLASTGPDEVVSSRLEPGADPIAEAHRRGSILLVIRLGNIDLEAPNTPPMDAPSQYAPRPLAPHGFPPPGGMPPVPGMPPMPGGLGAPAPGGSPQPILPPPVGPMGKAPAKSDVQQVSHQQPAAPKSTSSWWPFGSSK